MASDSISYKLIGTEVSLYTGKARSYLRWKGVSYKSVLSSDAVYRELIKPYTHIQSIPVLLITHHGAGDQLEVIQDTKEIMDYFESKNPILPETPKRAFAASVLEILADEWLLLQAMYWRWGDGEYHVPAFNDQLSFLEFEFGRTSTSSTPFASTANIREVGNTRLQRFKASLPALGITPTTSPVLREQFYALLQAMEIHFESNSFLLGKTITMADFAWYGPFYAHLGRDPIPSSIIKTKAPSVWEWIERVGGAGRPHGIDVQRWMNGKVVDEYDETVQDEIENDDVPSTLEAIVKLLAKDYFVVLNDTVNTTVGFIKKQQSADGKKVKIPRAIGQAKYRLSRSDGTQAEGKRSVSTHGLWTLQRLVDRTYSSEAQQTATHAWLTQMNAGLSELWMDTIKRWQGSGCHMEREENQLVAVPQSQGYRL
ncbi:hypothetical protein K402DRAFT_326812 [Aulographum hederae CBS 113979]|uniref:GST N-terminal domain-containing protein n=1 Tax=Aulographum hederae CBS 113979 TaxID=1176131 RepID=A0A6G1H8X6_9PEZI|nr:hypothetical protein K402DRAFT_326812 [Aulographum hederae CBS 113979]